ncbi:MULTISPECIES: hypothetical protein [Spirulina sp. CCY15215]|uniref:hypothetical protein n=1 Tax=Spirulina sp. CCY15215 TaxID=2767591 RepID=UPI001950AE71|nr:hypothetical protein [Spirulina major]
MSINLIILIAAIIVTWLVFTWLIKIVKVSIKTALTIAAIVLILQLVFGIGPKDLWEQILQLPETIQKMFR